MMRDSPIQFAPIVKWAGGKRQLLTKLLPHVPKRFSTYIEPFAGGAALFFGLCGREQQKKCKFDRAILCDQNEELIACYRAVQSDVSDLIEALSAFRYDRDLFYEVRAQDTAGWSDVARGARFLFLNRTCFNGLWRVNSKGKFNVPFGRYTNPRIVDAQALKRAHEAFSRVDLLRGDFSDALKNATSKDFVYFDPPYVPLSKTASFTAYAKEGFGEADQRRLLDSMRDLSRKGVPFMLSNADTADTRALYREFTIHGVPAARAVNSDPTKRGAVRELIVLAPGSTKASRRTSLAQASFDWENK